MDITSRLRKANPVGQPTMTPRGRAELRALVGPDNVPEMTSEKPTASPSLHRKGVWLAPIAAATLVIGGVAAGMTLSSDDGGPVLAPYVFADEIYGPVVSSEVSPERYGTSIIVDIPLAPVGGKPAPHLVQRIWFVSDDAWVDVPDNLTLRLTGVTDGVGTYAAKNWPFQVSYTVAFVGPESSLCTADESDTGPGTQFSASSQSDDGSQGPNANTTYYLCDGSMLDSGDPAYISSDMFSGDSDATTFSAELMTTDPDAAITHLKELELSPDGLGGSVHSRDGYWPEFNWDFPGIPQPGQPLSQAEYSETTSEWEVVLVVDERGQCTITKGVEYFDKTNYQLNDDGTCSYK